MATNAEKKNEARLKREQAQAAAAAAAKRNKLLQYLGGAVFAALVVVVLVVVITGGSNDDSGPGIGGDDSGEVLGTAETKTLLAGVQQSGLTIGDPKAPVTILEFIDVQCPYCKEHMLDQTPKVVNELVKTGKARVRLMPIALGFMGEDSEAGRTVAVRLAAKDKAWPFLNLFYWNQGNETTGYVTNEYLKKLTVAAGATAADASPREPTAEEAAKLQEIDDVSEKLGVSGTPTFAIGKNGQDPTTFKTIEVTGNGSIADQIINAANELAGDEAGTTPGT